MSPQDHALGGIARRNGHLYVEGVTAQALAERFGTPLYAYSRSMIEQAYLAFEKALGDRPHMVCYAMKANSNLGVLSVLARLGAGSGSLERWYRLFQRGVSLRTRAPGRGSGKARRKGTGVSANQP